jgi:transcriptional regulator with GAF, ATPase, and Fis domain
VDDRCNLFELIDTVASLNSTILIQGETGTGKELIAKALFQRSREQKMISINCGDSGKPARTELFGHVKAHSRVPVPLA